MDPLQYKLFHDTDPPSDPSGLAPRQRWLTIATSDIDRAGDILELGGAELDDFHRNPQFLWMHGMTDEALHTIGRILRIEQRGNRLLALAEYAPPALSPLADLIYEMEVAGYLPANSIGFHPIKWKANEHGGRTYAEWQLVEVSKVELPMNPNAVDSKRITIDEALQRWV